MAVTRGVVVNMETCKQTCKQSRSTEGNWGYELATCLCDTRYVLAWDYETGMLAVARRCYGNGSGV